jgi:hypothetical protein
MFYEEQFINLKVLIFIYVLYTKLGLNGIQGMEESLLPSRTIQTGSVVPCTIKRLVWSLMLNLFLEEACTSETSPVAPTIARRNSPGIELTSLINHRETINSVIIKDLSLFI